MPSVESCGGVVRLNSHRTQSLVVLGTRHLNSWVIGKKHLNVGLEDWIDNILPMNLLKISCDKVIREMSRQSTIVHNY